MLIVAFYYYAECRYAECRYAIYRVASKHIHTFHRICSSLDMKILNENTWEGQTL
jgi:hypothetical protein